MNSKNQEDRKTLNQKNTKKPYLRLDSKTTKINIKEEILKVVNKYAQACTHTRTHRNNDMNNE